MKPFSNSKPAIKTTGKQTPDLRKVVRETAHRTTGSRAPVVPQERTDQPRKHGQHRGPRATD